MLKRIFALALLAVLISLIVAQNVFRENCLRDMNEIRTFYDQPEFVLDESVHLKALGWARHLARTGKFEHRPNNPYGENIYMGSTLESMEYAMQAILAWYGERTFFSYSNMEVPEAANLTRIVWKSSKKLGCAFATNGTRFYAVANFDPPGNIPGEYEENIPLYLVPTTQ